MSPNQPTKTGLRPMQFACRLETFDQGVLSATGDTDVTGDSEKSRSRSFRPQTILTLEMTL